MDKDTVDEILGQWSDERPELDISSLGVVIRVMALNKQFAREASSALEALDIELFEYDVLSALRRQGRPFALPATGLAREAGLSTGAMTNRIDKLESRDLVHRQEGTSPAGRPAPQGLSRVGKELIPGGIASATPGSRHQVLRSSAETFAHP